MLWEEVVRPVKANLWLFLFCSSGIAPGGCSVCCRRKEVRCAAEMAEVYVLQSGTEGLGGNLCSGILHERTRHNESSQAVQLLVVG